MKFNFFQINTSSSLQSRDLPARARVNVALTRRSTVADRGRWWFLIGRKWRQDTHRDSEHQYSATRIFFSWSVVGSPRVYFARPRSARVACHACRVPSTSLLSSRHSLPIAFNPGERCATRLASWGQRCFASGTCQLPAGGTFSRVFCESGLFNFGQMLKRAESDLDPWYALDISSLEFRMVICIP